MDTNLWKRECGERYKRRYCGEHTYLGNKRKGAGNQENKRQHLVGQQIHHSTKKEILSSLQKIIPDLTSEGRSYLLDKYVFFVYGWGTGSSNIYIYMNWINHDWFLNYFYLIPSIPFKIAQNERLDHNTLNNKPFYVYV